MKKPKLPKSQQADKQELQEIVGQLIETGEEFSPDVQAQLIELNKKYLV